MAFHARSAGIRNWNYSYNGALQKSGVGGVFTHWNFILGADSGNLGDLLGAVGEGNCRRELVNVDRGPLGKSMLSQIIIVGGDAFLSKFFSDFQNCLRAVSVQNQPDNSMASTYPTHIFL